MHGLSVAQLGKLLSSSKEIECAEDLQVVLLTVSALARVVEQALQIVLERVRAANQGADLVRRPLDRKYNARLILYRPSPAQHLFILEVHLADSIEYAGAAPAIGGGRVGKLLGEARKIGEQTLLPVGTHRWLDRRRTCKDPRCDTLQRWFP